MKLKRLLLASQQLILMVLVYFILAGFCKAQYLYPFQNPDLLFEERVNDLVSRLTLEEKVSQMQNASPAIKRLGIPAYNWWNECLHGVGRSGVNVTVFPQAIAMAATFDDPALYKMARITSDEARAIYNDTKRLGILGTQYRGLTFWTPNINIFRDPRWGRGQETYGEDPYLTSVMGTSMVKGLQGDDPKYLKVSACAKHYAVHSGPEAERHKFDITVSENDLWNTYLPAFEKLVVGAKVSAVMCAYNRFSGEPCCANKRLMTDILRNQWGFSGYVTSDCGAIDDFYLNHKTHPDAISAAIDAVSNGTDLECGDRSYATLVDAVKADRISEKMIDVSVKRLFLIRMRLGMFDPENMGPYNQIPMSDLESASHHAQALKMARESIVLLKNENNTLPLKKHLKKIAVIGPNANNEVALLANYNGFPTKIVTALEGIKAKVGPQTEVIFEPGCSYNTELKYLEKDLNSRLMTEGTHGWNACYYINSKLEGNPTYRSLTNAIDFNMNESNEIVSGIKAKNISIKYTTTFTPDSTANYVFEISGDDGYRFYVNDQKMIDEWYDHGIVKKMCSFHACKDSIYQLTIEYYQGGGGAVLKVSTGIEANLSKDELVKKVKDADAIVFVGGISNDIEEEDKDRTSLELPAVQTEYLKALQATGVPVIFIMYTGSPLSINWEAENLPAIVNAWYAGQDAGTAIADVLFGDYNPAGRLPVTFYKSDQDLPAFEDYSMSNRTYRYFKGNVLYPFGFGLSYSKFEYSWASLPSDNYTPKDTITFSINVKNVSTLDGEEVVQAYIQYPDGKNLPLKELHGFRRMEVEAGNIQNLQMMISVIDLKKWDENAGKCAVPPGNYKLILGGSSTDDKLITTFTVKN